MIKLVVFDMAGTTVDEDNAVYKTLHQMIVNGGYDVSLESVLQHGAGKAKRVAMEDVLRNVFHLEDASAVADRLYEGFDDKLREAYHVLPVHPQPGATEVFKTLQEKGIAVALNTGYSREIAELLLNRLGWKVGETVDFLVTTEEVYHGRPHPDMIHRAMAYFNITDGAEVAKVGDSAIDVEEGHSAGCRIAAGILTGAQTEAQLREARPTHVFHQLSDLLTALDD